MMLRDCIVKEGDTELIIACSSSAREVAIAGRDRMAQALLSIDTPSHLGDELPELLDNELVKSLIAALGVGIYWSKSEDDTVDWTHFFDLSNLRYRRIILALEESDQGVELRNNVVKIFFELLRPVIDHGHLLVPSQPLDPARIQDEFESRILDSKTRQLKVVKASETWQSTSDSI